MVTYAVPAVESSLNSVSTDNAVGITRINPIFAGQVRHVNEKEGSTRLITPVEETGAWQTRGLMIPGLEEKSIVIRGGGKYHFRGSGNWSKL
jgi:hypothetical protein